MYTYAHTDKESERHVELALHFHFFRRSPAKHRKKNPAIHKNITIKPLYTFGFVIGIPLVKMLRTYFLKVVGKMKNKNILYRNND